ncbi:response regulator [Caproicibacter sp.]|uniref:response regulator n=1 Tax=Caproicibacter sp. TaxID=2814884 RepID=UPI003988DFDA
MNILAVDDERLALDSILSKLREVDPAFSVRGFLSPNDALEDIYNGFRPDVAFLDIEMYDLNGIEVALELKKVFPRVNIIFVTGFSEYAQDAFALHASGYLTKPVRVERIREELENLRHPLQRVEHHIRVQTFGYFEIFVDDVPVQFQRSRTKELLAYLVDRRGASSSTAELAAVLWEDRKYNRSLQNQLQVHVSDLIRSLKNVKAEEIICKKRNSIAVDVTSFDCDYYRFLNGDTTAINAFTGEYMANYSWAELTTGQLFKAK